MEVNTAGTNSPVAEKKGISGYGLKMIAVVTMLIDHTAATILERILMQMQEAGIMETSTTYSILLMVYFVMRIIGRMAFPIYCFLLVEGFHYTRNRAKYALRLFVFALISEVPFDMAFNQTILEFSYNNVFFTLFLGLLTIMAADWIKEKGLPKVLTIFLMLLCLVAGAAVAQFVFHTDYSAWGVMAIYIMYLLYEKRMQGFTLMMVPLVMSSLTEAAALLMLIPLHFYNGTRGKQIKYFFYAFYPAHLLILSLICWAMGLGI